MIPFIWYSGKAKLSISSCQGLELCLITETKHKADLGDDAAVLMHHVGVIDYM